MGSETDSFVYINAALGKQIRVFDGGCHGEDRATSGTPPGQLFHLKKS